MQRQRFSADEVDEVLAEVRALLRERGRPSTQWEVGSSASPAGLVDQLLERGLVRDRDPFAVALVLTREPPPAARRLVARRVETFEEYAAANAVQWVAFEMTEATIEEARALLEQNWRETVNIMHGVWLDGELVCTGTSMPTETYSCSTGALPARMPAAAAPIGRCCGRAGTRPPPAGRPR